MDVSDQTVSEQTVVSADGTTIALRRTGTGHGPALVVAPGNNRMAHNYDRFAAALADDFDVCVIERRGRGRSGPQGSRYSLDREVEDLEAVRRAVGAEVVFGHSYGGLVTLTAAAADPGIQRLVAYEPAVSIDGSFDLAFRHEFRRRFDRGDHVGALALFFHETGLLPLRWTPYALCWVMSWLMVGRPSEVRDLMPTTAAELDEIARADNDGSAYAAVAADTLLIGGTRSPGYLPGVLEPLVEIMPHARRIILDGADHNAPDENAPDRVAAEVRAFLAEPTTRADAH